MEFFANVFKYETFTICVELAVIGTASKDKFYIKFQTTKCLAMFSDASNFQRLHMQSVKDQ